MLSENYDMNDTKSMVSEARELLGDLRAIWEEAKYRLDSEDYEDDSERGELETLFETLDRHIFDMYETLENDAGTISDLE